MEQSNKNMSSTLIKQTYQKIKSYLAQSKLNELTQTELQMFLRQKLQNSLQCEPQMSLNSIQQLQTLKQPIIINAELMVHDMIDGGYLTPYLIEKPFNQMSDVQILKYGNSDHNQQYDQSLIQKLNNQKYFRFFQQRQILICTPILYETQWCKKVTENKLKNQQKIEIIMNFRSKFKLGQTINIIGLWNPNDKKLYFIKEIPKQKLAECHPLTKYFSLEIKNFQQTRKQLLTFISKFVSQKYAFFVLYSILSRNFFFISAEWNISQIVKLLLPRVNSVRIKAPFQQSLFPYKNQDELIVNTPMEMSSDHTYTILDFSGLSQDKQVKIKQAEIDNLKALKIFVEQGQTIYRWIYGESLISHAHTGMIIKASTIINPQFIIKGQKQFDLSKLDTLIKEISQQKLHQFRAYIYQARKLDSFLNEQSRKEVQSHMHENIKIFNETSINQVMELSKINAQSLGRSQTKYQDYIHSSKLYFGQQTFLTQTAQFKKKQQKQEEEEIQIQIKIEKTQKSLVQKQTQSAQKQLQKHQNPQKPEKSQKQ